MSFQEVGLSYLLATGSSVSLALSLTHTLKNSIWIRFVPFWAVGISGALNVGFMRMKELKEGIDVKNSGGDNEILGKSRLASWNSVSQVALSRFVTAIPALILPPLLLHGLRNNQVLKKHTWLKIPLNLGLITLGLSVGLPLAISLSPQHIHINPSQLESKFWNLKDSRGQLITNVTYNKGL